MERLKKINLKTVFPFLGLAAVIILFQVLTGGKVFSIRNLKAIMNDSFFILIGTVAFSFIMAVGNLDLSMGTVMAVSCTCAAFASGISPVLAIPAAVLAGLVLGCFNADRYHGNTIGISGDSGSFAGWRYTGSAGLHVKVGQQRFKDNGYDPGLIGRRIYL